jgi:hypothetical protein
VSGAPILQHIPVFDFEGGAMLYIISKCHQCVDQFPCSGDDCCRLVLLDPEDALWARDGLVSSAGILTDD